MGFWGRLYGKIRKALTPVVRWTTDGFSFCYKKLSATARALVNFAREHPWRFGFYSVLIIGGIVFIVVPPALGFTASGVAAASHAAAAQSVIGNVAAGSFFAFMQSATATGLLSTIGLWALGLGVVGLVADFLNWWYGRGNGGGNGGGGGGDDDNDDDAPPKKNS